MIDVMKALFMKVSGARHVMTKRWSRYSCRNTARSADQHNWVKLDELSERSCFVVLNKYSLDLKNENIQLRGSGNHHRLLGGDASVDPLCKTKCESCRCVSSSDWGFA